MIDVLTKVALEVASLHITAMLFTDSTLVGFVVITESTRQVLVK